jgi:hypothetical protein
MIPIINAINEILLNRIFLGSEKGQTVKKLRLQNRPFNKLLTERICYNNLSFII